MTKYISLFGGPGSGKTTTALGLCYALKCRGLDVEYIPESFQVRRLARGDIEIGGALHLANIQEEISTYLSEHHKLANNRADYVVTDAPLAMQSIYWLDESLKWYVNPKRASQMVTEHNLYWQLNLFCHSSLKYDQRARYHTEEEAACLSNKISAHLHNVLNRPFFKWDVQQPIEALLEFIDPYFASNFLI